MAHQVTLQEAQMKLSELLQEAIDGEEVVVVQGKKILAHLVPHKKKFNRRIGTALGEVTIKKGFKDIPEDFKEYLS